MHATLATHASLDTLAALGVIFQAFPALCPCEPRRPLGKMQVVPGGARSDTRLLPGPTSQPPPVDIRSVRKCTTGIFIYDVNTILIFSDTSSYPARKETPAHPHPDAFRSCLDMNAPERRESAGLPLSAPMPTKPRQDPR